MKMISKAILTLAAVAVLAVPAMAANAKLKVNDGSGATKFVVNDDGTVGAGVASTIYPFEMTSDNAGAVPAGVGSFLMNGNTNKERFEVRSAGIVFGQGPTFQGKGAGGTIAAPTKTLTDHVLFALGGSGHDGTQWIIANRALVKIKAPADWSATSTPTMVSFEATPVNSTSRVEYMSVNGNGVTGVTVSNAPLRLSTPGTAPACDLTRRGSFWVSQGASVDTVQVCVQTSTNVYAWKTVTLQ